MQPGFDTEASLQAADESPEVATALESETKVVSVDLHERSDWGVSTFWYELFVVPGVRLLANDEEPDGLRVIRCRGIDEKGR